MFWSELARQRIYDLLRLKSRGSVVVAALVVVAAGIVGWSALPSGDVEVGIPAHAPTTWPESTDLMRDESRPTLVVFAHPQCACTSATMSEVDRIVQGCEGKLHVVVSILSAPELETDVEPNDLWKAALAIPDADVHADRLGANARCFGVQTSGQCLLYASDGRLVFQGGITEPESRQDVSAGARAIQDFVHGQPLECSTTSVYGCDLRRNQAIAVEARP